MANSSVPPNLINKTDPRGSDGQPVQLAYLATLVPAVFANLLAIVIFGRSLRKNYPVLNLFLFSLSCVDVLGCFYGFHATVVPLYIDKLTPSLCHVVSFVGDFCGLLSALCAALLALDRYYALCRPYDYRRVFDRKRAYIYITILIILATFICLLNIMGLGVSYFYLEVAPGVRSIICSSRVYQHEPQRRVFGYVYGSAGCCVLLVVIVCNIKVIMAVLKMRRSVLTVGTIADRPKSPMANAMQTEVKFARVIGALSVLLLICWAPFMSNSMVNGDGNLYSDLNAGSGILARVSSIYPDTLPQKLTTCPTSIKINAFLSQTDVVLSKGYEVTSAVLVSMNFIIDPFVFLVLKKSYRQEAVELFRKALCCRHTSEQRNVEGPSTVETTAADSKGNDEMSV